jgi:hypothetical protein
MDLVCGPNEVDFVGRSMQPVVAQVNAKEGDHMKPPCGLQPVDGIMVVDPALYEQFQVRNEHFLNDKVRKHAVAHAN